MREGRDNRSVRAWTLIGDFLQKRFRCEEFEREIDRLRQAKLIPVEGEASLLSELKNLLAKIDAGINLLLKVDSQTAVDEYAGRIEEFLSDARWEVLDDVLNDLMEKGKEQERLVSGFKSQIKEWRNTATLLDAKLEKALKVRAPVRQWARVLKELASQIDRLEQDFRESNYAGVQEMLKRIEGGPMSNGDFAKDLDEKTEAAKVFHRQADLMLLQYPLDSDRQYQYTVLLRTPNQDGSQGINIQDSSTLVEPDRREMSAAIRKVTEAIDQGVRSRHFIIEADNPPDDFVTTTGVASLPPRTENVGEMVKRIGDLMYRLFLPEQFRDYLYFEKCSLTITTNDLELPWELMTFADKWAPYEEKYLCLVHPIARMPMGHAFPRRPRANEPKPSLRFLLIHSDPYNNLPNAGYEVKKIADDLKKNWGDRIDVDVLDQNAASGRSMNDLLRGGSYDVVHYAGHAYFNDRNADLSGLVLKDETNKEVRFLAQKIRRLIEGQPLVFLNACQSGRAANERERVIEYLQQPAEGLASAFIYGGAIGCIGSLWPVYDDAAADFAVSFYNHVLEGHMIGDAMRLSRIEIKNKYPDQITWAAYVLYGNPTCTL